MTPGGSYSDHVCLADALGRYEQAERIHTLSGSKFFGTAADRHFMTLTRLAFLCGFSARTSNESIVSWSRQRVETFARFAGARRDA